MVNGVPKRQLVLRMLHGAFDEEVERLVVIDIGLQMQCPEYAQPRLVNDH